MRKLPLLLLSATLLASGAYVFVYLSRWEWTRALFVTMIFVAAETALVGWLVLGRIRRLEQRIGSADVTMAGTRDERVLYHLRRSRPEVDRFAWLAEAHGRTNVFVTMLVGGGVVLSGLAWVVDKIAGRTVTASAERQLADALGPIALPDEHLVADESSLIAQELPAAGDPELRLLVGDTWEPPR